MAEVTEEQLQALYADIPFGLPEEPLPSKEALGFRVPLVWLRHVAEAVYKPAAIGDWRPSFISIEGLIREPEVWPPK